MQTRYFDLRDTKGQQKEIEDKIAAAAKILRDGGLVGIPTETVYGLGANALDGAAVKRIFEAKGRPQDNPLIIHVTGAQWLPRYCADVPPLAYVLARKFWPGPLTMILKRRPIIPDETTAGLDTVAVRCPNHPVTLAIIREAGVPIAAPSANLSGRPSCTTGWSPPFWISPAIRPGCCGPAGCPWRTWSGSSARSTWTRPSTAPWRRGRSPRPPA